MRDVTFHCFRYKGFRLTILPQVKFLLVLIQLNHFSCVVTQCVGGYLGYPCYFLLLFYHILEFHALGNQSIPGNILVLYLLDDSSLSPGQSYMCKVAQCHVAVATMGGKLMRTTFTWASLFAQSCA